MRLQYLPLVFSAFVAADLQYSLDSQLSGDDFDFEATYPSGLKLTTKEDDAKRGVLDYREVTDLVPDIVVKGLDDEAREKKYIAFVVMSRIPTIDMLDDVLWGLPWVGTNLTILSNGTLSWGDEYVGGRTQDVDGGEVRNGSLHLWEHTQEIDAELNDEFAGGPPLPVWFNIIRVWTNRTDAYPFKLSNIDFKFQNEGGDKRCDVSVTGAPIPGVEVGDDESCEKTPTPEKNEKNNGDDGKDDKNDDNNDDSDDGDGDNDNASDSSEGGGEDDEDAGSLPSMNWSLASLAVFCAAAVATL